MNKVNLFIISKLQFIQFFLLIIISILFNACNENTTEVIRNVRIEKNTKSQIKRLNDQLVEAIVTNDVERLKKMMADDFLKDTGVINLKAYLTQYSANYKSPEYAVLDEYNVFNSKAGVENIISSVATNHNDYMIGYFSNNKESYASLLILKGEEDLLITAIYGKLNNDWKLTNLHFGTYRLFNLTAPNYHQLAKESYGQSRLMEALCYSNLAMTCLNPGASLIFVEDNEIREFNTNIINETNAKFQFPITLKNIPTKPRIFQLVPRMRDQNIFPQIIENGVFTTVYYLTDINLKDKKALSIENEKIKKEMVNVFNEINMGKKYIFYLAFNEMPDGIKEVNYEGFVETLTD